MATMRFKRALCAMHDEGFPYVLDVVARTADEYRRRNDRHLAVYGLLSSLKDDIVDALHVVMYEGRDEYLDGCPLVGDGIDKVFAEMWDHLGMDQEPYARECMGEKAQLGEYLRRGAYMFSLSGERS